MNAHTLSLRAMDNLLRRTGANRINKTAKKSLRDYLEDLAEQVCQRARQNAIHAKRRTINDEDIRLATKR